MKTILCYGDSNTWGCVPITSFANVGRFGPDVRWGSVLRTTLGNDFWVVEEGLGGRTTVFADPVEGEHKSGKMYLTACLESHQPIDLVTVLLGTNDLKSRFNLSPWNIAAGAETLINIIMRSTCGPNMTAPKVLLICPPPVAELPDIFAEMFAGAWEKSRQLAPYYKKISQQLGCEFMDAGEVIVSSKVDGIHFDASEHQKLGKAVAAKVKQIL